MADPGVPVVSVSRRIEAPAAGVGDVFVMAMHYSVLGGDYEMDNHVVSYDVGRRIGWEPVAGRGHPEPGSCERHRWSFELTPDGPGATVVTESYDCSRMSEEWRAKVNNGHAWAGAMAKTLERLDCLCTGSRDGS